MTTISDRFCIQYFKEFFGSSHLRYSRNSKRRQMCLLLLLLLAVKVKSKVSRAQIAYGDDLATVFGIFDQEKLRQVGFDTRQKLYYPLSLFLKALKWAGIFAMKKEDLYGRITICTKIIKLRAN